MSCKKDRIGILLFNLVDLVTPEGHMIFVGGMISACLIILMSRLNQLQLMQSNYKQVWLMCSISLHAVVLY